MIISQCIDVLYDPFTIEPTDWVSFDNEIRSDAPDPEDDDEDEWNEEAEETIEEVDEWGDPIIPPATEDGDTPPAEEEEEENFGWDPDQDDGGTNGDLDF